MAEPFAVEFLANIRILFVAILIYALIYAILIKIKVFEETKINSLIALMTAIIVSLSGVITYVVSYAIDWFIILMFILFLMLTLLLFLGVKGEDIASSASSNKGIIAGVFIALFLIIIVNGFFALNNSYDVNNPENNSYVVDTNPNFGAGKIDTSNTGSNFTESLSNIFNSDFFAAFLFLTILGVFVWLLGR
jgi:hypothetical protein